MKILITMEQTSSRESYGRSVDQNISSRLWKPKLHYRLEKMLPLVRILSKINPVHILTPCLLTSILILSSHLRTGFRSDPFRLTIKLLYEVLISPMRATCPPFHLLDLIALIIFEFGEEWKF